MKDVAPSSYPDAILLDCDGVVLESEEMKVAAFLRLLPQEPRKLAEMRAYINANAGLPRHEKLRHIFGGILRQPFSAADEVAFSRRYGAAIKEEYHACPLVPGARELLETYASRCPLFLVSGTPEGELRAAIEAHGLTAFFAGIFGAPAHKTALCADILRRWRLDSRRAVMVGDSYPDIEAAQANGIPFIGRLRPEGVTFQGLGVPTAEDLRGVQLLLERGLAVVPPDADSRD